MRDRLTNENVSDSLFGYLLYSCRLLSAWLLLLRVLNGVYICVEIAEYCGGVAFERQDRVLLIFWIVLRFSFLIFYSSFLLLSVFLFFFFPSLFRSLSFSLSSLVSSLLSSFLFSSCLQTIEIETISPPQAKGVSLISSAMILLHGMCLMNVLICSIEHRF